MKITLSEYQNEALMTLNEQIAKSKKEQARYCCFGMAEETGEIIAELRKPLFKGNYHEKKINKEAITSECGDLLWYMALMCKESEIDIEKIDAPTYKKAGVGDRETLLQRGIKLIQRSDKTVRRYLQYHRGEVKKSQLESSLRRQYKCMKGLLRELNISIEEVIDNNLDKIRSRYEVKSVEGVESDER